MKIALSASARSSTGFHAESYISLPTAPYFYRPPPPSIPVNHVIVSNFEAPNPYFYNHSLPYWQMQPAVSIESSTSADHQVACVADGQEETNAASVLMALLGNNAPCTD